MTFKEACMIAFRDNRCLPALVSELQDSIWEKGNFHPDTVNILDTYTEQLLAGLSGKDINDDAGYQELASQARNAVNGKDNLDENVVRFKRIHNNLSEAIYSRTIFTDVD